MNKACSPADFLRLSRERNGQLSPLRQLAEAAALFILRGVGPGYYQTAGFWRRDMDWRSKTGHLSAKEYQAVLGRLNRAPYRKLSQHKVSEKALLRLFDVPSSEYLGVYSPLDGSDAQGRPLRSQEDLSRFLSEFPEGSRLCLKPLEGWAGGGVELATVTHRNAVPHLTLTSTGETCDVEAFCRDTIAPVHGNRAVIERYLEQHPEMARFNPSSVNTLRYWVLRRAAAPPEVILGYLRIGREGSVVDNQSSGGIVAPVDLKTGRLSEAIDGLPSRRCFPAHPDHGARIEGQVIPFFEASLELAARCLLPFFPLRFAGVDIAVTDHGPCVIELNVSPDREGAAFTNTLTKDILGSD